jgi:hypothetical protein
VRVDYFANSILPARHFKQNYLQISCYQSQYDKDSSQTMNIVGATASSVGVCPHTFVYYITLYYTYRVIQEESPLLWGMIV